MKRTWLITRSLAVMALLLSLAGFIALGCELPPPRECVTWGETQTQVHLHRVGKVPHCLEWK